MADIALTFEGTDFVIDQDLFTKLKEQAYDLLKKTPKGLESTVADINFETFRRMLTTGFPTNPTGQAEDLIAAAWNTMPGGLLGLVYNDFYQWLAGTPTKECVISLTEMILIFGCTELDGEITPISEGVWDNNNVEDLVFKMAKALQRALSGQEVGF